MNINEEGWQGFLKLCLKVQSDAKLEILFNLLFTSEEKDSLTTRYLIIRDLLQQKKTQREIAKDLNVSIAKITRGSNEIKRMSEAEINHIKSLIVECD